MQNGGPALEPNGGAGSPLFEGKLSMKISTLVWYLPLLLAFPRGSLGQVAPQATGGGRVAMVAGQPISDEELMDTLGAQQSMQLRTQEYEAKSKALESLIRLKLVQAEAKKRGISAEKLIEQEVESKVADPTDGEVEAYFWGQNRAGASFDEVKEQYRASLKQLKLQKARQVYADSLRAKIDVAVLLRPPSVNVAYDPARAKGESFGNIMMPYTRTSPSWMALNR